jgi:hypothetical protein
VQGVYLTVFARNLPPTKIKIDMFQHQTKLSSAKNTQTPNIQSFWRWSLLYCW